jgi:hypothetical protein
LECIGYLARGRAQNMGVTLGIVTLILSADASFYTTGRYFFARFFLQKQIFGAINNNSYPINAIHCPRNIIHCSMNAIS